MTRGKRRSALMAANKELALQHWENKMLTNELAMANIELAFEKGEKGKRAEELIIINTRLKKAEKNNAEYLRGLRQMIIITSHKVRHPIASILGLANLLVNSVQSSREFKQLIGYINESAVSLDLFTKELNTYMSTLEKRIKAKHWL